MGVVAAISISRQPREVGLVGRFAPVTFANQ